MIYYSPSQRAFYDDALFGPRQIEVIDEKLQDAAIKKALAGDDAEFEDAKASAPIAAIDASGQILHPLRSSYQRRYRQALDNPIMKTVSNQNCLLPEDAIEVSADEHAELMRQQAEGLEIVPGADGRPVARPIEQSQEQVIATVRRLRDRALAASDWTQLPDAAEALSAAKRQAWAEHRRKLRNLPAEVEAAFAAGAQVGLVRPAELLPAPPA